MFTPRFPLLQGRWNYIESDGTVCFMDIRQFGVGNQLSMTFSDGMNVTGNANCVIDGNMLIRGQYTNSSGDFGQVNMRLFPDGSLRGQLQSNANGIVVAVSAQRLF